MLHSILLIALSYLVRHIVSFSLAVHLKLAVSHISHCYFTSSNFCLFLCHVWRHTRLCSWPVLFNLNTTPLVLWSVFLPSHTYYATTSQLFISLIPKRSSSAIFDQQSVVSLISFWMSLYQLTLNPPKTE